MADKLDVSAKENEAGELRSKLIKRLAIAGGLVGILLGVLAFFDYLAAPPEEQESPVFNSPVPVAPKRPVSQPVKPTSELPEPPAPVVVEPPPSPPAVSAEPSPGVVRPEPKAGGRPAPSTGEASIKSRPDAGVALPVVAPPQAPAPTPRVVRQAPEYTAAPTRMPPDESSVLSPRPTARVIETRQVPVVVPPSGMARLFSGFLLQAGVFSSPQRAEELHAKLTLSGVPSTLETRVQVGPFRTRQEAEMAQEKLKELGVESVLIPPKSGKH